MSRVITKPSDIHHIEIGGPEFEITGKPTKVVTLDQCKQIAEAYGVARVLRTLGLANNAEAWESLFNSPEWRGKG
jgi:hypothetical protein